MILKFMKTYVLLAMNLWCHDKTSDRVFTFDRWRAKFALRCAKFFQVFKHGVYTIPTVITSLVNGEDVKGIFSSLIAISKSAFRSRWRCIQRSMDFLRKDLFAFLGFYSVIGYPDFDDWYHHRYAR